MAIDPNAALRALPGFPQLQGARVRLRGPREDDAQALFAVFSDAAVMRYWSRTPMTELSEAAALIVEIEESFAQRALIQWVIADRRDDRALGTCSLFHFDARHRRAEIGYALGADVWGRGLATEAAALALQWAFSALGLHRIEADVDPRNEASRRLLLRLGFVSEGLLRQRFLVDGQAADSEVFGLLAEDWRRRDAHGRGG